MKSECISTVKAIGILLMVAAHAGCPDLATRFIYLFHMPLFFIISGYCFNEKYIQDKSLFIKKRTKGLYWPFVKYSILFLILHNVFFALNIYNGEYGWKGITSVEYTGMDMWHKAGNIITLMTDNEQLLGGYWFLKQLFFGSIIAMVLISYTGRFAALILLALTILCFSFPHISFSALQLNGVTAHSALFYTLGYLIRKHNIVLPQKGLCVTLPLLAVAALYFPFLEMSTMDIQTLVPYTIMALLGTMSVFTLSTMLQEKGGNICRSLVYIGKHTLPILTWHFLSFKLVSLLIIAVYHNPITWLACFPRIPKSLLNTSSDLWWILYFVVGCGLPLLSMKIWDRAKEYIPNFGISDKSNTKSI